MDIYLHEILFMLCFLYHFDSFTLGCLGMKPWDITCTSKFYCNSWAASTYHVMLHKVSFLATSQFCAWRPLYDLSRQKHNSEIIENEIENVELGALLLLCFVINMNFCKLIDCVIFSHMFVRFAFYCLILIKGKFNKTIISAISVAIDCFRVWKWQLHLKLVCSACDSKKYQPHCFLNVTHYKYITYMFLYIF